MRLFLVLFFAVFFISIDGRKISSRKITDGVSVSLPKDFVLMSDDDLAQKYPSTKKPLAMYSSLDRNVDFGLNVSKSKIPGSDLKVIKDIYKSTILNSFTKVEFLQDDVKEIKKRDFIRFEFISEFERVKKYNFIQYTMINNQVFIFNFSVPNNLKEEWQPTARAIMQSIKIQDSKLKLPEESKASSKGKSPQQVLQQQKSKKK